MNNVMNHIEQVTPSWLTGVLRESGGLNLGQVTQVTCGEVQSSFASAVWRIEVSYSKDALPNAPKKLFLKCSNPATAPGVFDPSHQQKEILFYQSVAPQMAAGYTIPCYSAAFDPETGSSHLLLMDVSETHIPAATPPSYTHYEQVFDALAYLHAFWWDHPSLGREIGKYPTQPERQKSWINTKETTTAFVKMSGKTLPISWRNIYEHVLAALPNLFERHACGRNLTLAHGDAHLGNFLFPKNRETAKAYMIDWQFWHPTIGGTDLAFLLATESEIEMRHLYEQTLLRRYYQHLLAQGVQGYSWEQCWDDYRLSVILVSIFIPVWRWSLFQWEADMCAIERSMTAFEELNCFDLL